MEDKVKGKMKEAAGALTGDEEKKAEGQAQQMKGSAKEEARQKDKTSKLRKTPGRRKGSGTGRSGRTRGCWAAFVADSLSGRDRRS